MSEKKPCIHCNSEIDYCAKKCSICSGWQNWRRNLGTTNLILAVAVSGIALFFSVGKPILEFFDEEQPSLSATILYSDYNKLKIVLANLGNAPAGITEIFVSINNDHEQEAKFPVTKPWKFPIAKELWGKLMEKKSYEEITLTDGEGGGLPVMVNKNHEGFEQDHVGKCALNIKYKVFTNGADRLLTNEFDCYNFSPFANYLKRKDFH